MPIRVLLVDDSEETLEVLETQYGLHREIEVVATVENAANALGVLAAQAVDLVSIDIELGAQNGLELCSQLRRQYRNLFVAICSVEADGWMREKARRAGAQCLLEKPLYYSDIEELIRMYKSFADDDLFNSML